jgi:DHA1 family bicyclomycin/chloramphenicol resistance-like MFS transporter
MVFFLPALPSIAQSLHTTPNTAQLAVTCLLFGLATSQLFTGYLSDILSRTRLLFFFPPTFCLGAILCALTNNIYCFLVGIYLTGLASGGASIISLALSHDLNPKNPTKIIAFTTSIGTYLSALALVLSGYFAHHGHWRYMFFLISTFSIIISLYSLCIPTIAAKKKDAVNLSSMLKNYTLLLKDTNFLKFALPYAFSTTGYFIFYAVSPFLLIKDLHISAKIYGYMMLIIIFANMIGRALLGAVTYYLKRDILIYIGGGFCFLGSTSMIIFADFFHVSAWEIIGSMALFMIGSGILSPIFKSGVMLVFSLLAGAAVALISMTSNLVSASSTYLASKYLSNYLGTSLLILSILIFASYNICCRLSIKYTPD